MMWIDGRKVGFFLKALHRFQHFSKINIDSKQFCKAGFSSSRPPWRLLFFGTDDFAVESLKLLTFSRNSNEGIVQSLEVVTLRGDLPVKRFSQQNRLKIHDWPPQNVEGQFDVGVVVSFGCLLPKTLINQFPFGILNVHPSLLPRWRGPAPVFHTIMHGDAVTGVTIIQILPQKFDIGPILNQELFQVPENCTAEKLGTFLATKGAHLLLNTLVELPESIANKREQGQEGATFAPKINTSMSWMEWEEQTCEEISRLYRAIGSRIPLRTVWMGRTIKLMDFVGKYHMKDSRKQTPGSLHYDKDAALLAVSCKDGWVAFRTVVLNKRLTAADFYNGYLHQILKGTTNNRPEGLFFSKKRRRKNGSQECVLTEQQTCKSSL